MPEVVKLDSDPKGIDPDALRPTDGEDQSSGFGDAGEPPDTGDYEPSTMPPGVGRGREDRVHKDGSRHSQTSDPRDGQPDDSREKGRGKQEDDSSSQREPEPEPDEPPAALVEQAKRYGVPESIYSGMTAKELSTHMDQVKITLGNVLAARAQNQQGQPAGQAPVANQQQQQAGQQPATPPAGQQSPQGLPDLPEIQFDPDLTDDGTKQLYDSVRGMHGVVRQLSEKVQQYETMIRGQQREASRDAVRSVFREVEAHKDLFGKDIFEAVNADPKGQAAEILVNTLKYADALLFAEAAETGQDPFALGLRPDPNLLRRARDIALSPLTKAAARKEVEGRLRDRQGKFTHRPTHRDSGGDYLSGSEDAEARRKEAFAKIKQIKNRNQTHR